MHIDLYLGEINPLDVGEPWHCVVKTTGVLSFTTIGIVHCGSEQAREKTMKVLSGFC